MASKKVKNEKETSGIFRFARGLLSGFLGMWFRIRVVGGENEPEEGGFIVCANHTAASDAVVERSQDASIVNTAAEIGSMRVRLDGKGE